MAPVSAPQSLPGAQIVNIEIKIEFGSLVGSAGVWPGPSWGSCHGGTARSVKIEWTPSAVASSRRCMNDQDGMRVVGAAIEGLADDPCLRPRGFTAAPVDGFTFGAFRVMRVVEEDVITVARAGRLSPR